MNSEKRRQSDRMDAYVQRENIYDLISFKGLGTDIKAWGKVVWKIEIVAVVKFLAANGTSAPAGPLVYFVQRDFTDSLATELREQGAVLRLQITAT